MIANKIIIEERPCEIPLNEDRFIRAVASMIVKDILNERAGLKAGSQVRPTPAPAHNVNMERVTGLEQNQQGITLESRGSEHQRRIT